MVKTLRLMINYGKIIDCLASWAKAALTRLKGEAA